MIGALWLTAAWFHSGSTMHPGILILWSALSALAGIGLVMDLDFFKPMQVLPRKSDLPILYLALAAPALILKYLFVVLMGDAVLHYSDILAMSALLALVTYGLRWVSGQLFILRGEKKRILLLLSEEEKAEFLREIGWLRINDYLDCTTASFRTPDLILISRRTVRDFNVNSRLITARLRGVPVLDFRLFLSELRGKVNVDQIDMWSYMTSATRQTFFLKLYLDIKALVEPVVASLLLIALSPLLLCVAAAVRLSSPGPVLFRQVRTGFKGKTFELVKFRTMRADAEAQGAMWAAQNDSRMTKIGKILRATHLDELPQLWNVMKGEIGFIGPRPERPEFYARLEEQIPLFWLRTLIRPGITGWAQVHAGYAASVQESKLKLEYDLFYIQHASFRLDLIVVLRTIFRMASSGNYLNDNVHPPVPTGDERCVS